MQAIAQTVVKAMKAAILAIRETKSTGKCIQTTQSMPEMLWASAKSTNILLEDTTYV